jgi:hypothetical protein
MKSSHEERSTSGDGKRNINMPIRYHIRVRGHLDLSWSEWFEGMTITYELNGISDLFGTITDQAELIGVLTKIHNLNLEIISVNPEK